MLSFILVQASHGSLSAMSISSNQAAEVSEFNYWEQVGISDSQMLEMCESAKALFHNMGIMLTFQMDEMGPKLDDIANFQTSTTGPRLNEIQVFQTDTMDPKLDIVVGFVERAFMPGARKAGCDGVDQNNDDVADDCMEDEHPPEIVVPQLLPIDYESHHNDALRLKQALRSMGQVRHFFRSALRVEDDCARPEHLSLDIELLGGSCEETEVEVTPIHKQGMTTCSEEHELLGLPMKFLLELDDGVPQVTCGFGDDRDGTFITNRKFLFVPEDSDIDTLACQH